MGEHLTGENPVDSVAEEFARRWRAGEQPTITEYATRYPQWADEIRDILPAVVMMEQLKPSREDQPTVRTPRPASLTPERIGEYRIVREVGRGGMGIVYEAEQESLGRRVALKVLPSHLLSDDRLRSRFHREAHAAARLHHTNIVPVFAVGEQDGLCYYVMQLILGRGLDEVIGSSAATCVGTDADTAVEPRVEPIVKKKADPESLLRQVLPPASGLLVGGYARTVARIGVQVAEALAYAQRQGVLHRDIKPSNLLLDERGSVWVTDFGVAKLVEEARLTQSGDLVGTLKYMPPERFAGVSDARGDVYSLGITLYELLTLRPAFPDSTPHHLIHLITHEDPPRLRKLRPDVPADLETILQKAFARDPAHRYPTAAEFAEDLRRFLDDRPILARRTGPLGLAWRWCRRNPTLSGALTATFLMMATTTAIAVGAYVRTAAAHAETAAANREMENALAAEQAQREHAETTSTLALGALNRMYDRFAPSRLIVTPLTTEEGEELPPQPALPPEAVPLLEELLRTYEQIATSSREFPRLQAEAAEANHRIGDIRLRLGRFADAVVAYRTAIELRTHLPANSVGEAAHIKLARSYNELGRALRNLQEQEEAERMHLRAREVLTAADSSSAERPECRYELARTLYLLGQREPLPTPRVYEGDRFRRPGEPGPDRPRGPGGFGRPWPFGDRPMPPERPFGGPRPEAPVHQAIALLEPLVKEFPAVPEYRHLLACCYRDAPPEPRFGRGGPPSANLDRSVELLRQLVKDFPRVPDYRFDLCETLGRVGAAPPWAEQAAKTRARLEEAITLSGELVTQYPNVPQYTAARAQYYDRLAGSWSQARNLVEAEKALRKAVQLQAKLVKQYPDVVAYAVWLSRMELALARVLLDKNDLEGAQTTLQTAVVRLETLDRTDDRQTSVRGFLGMAYRELAQVHTRRGEKDLATAVQHKAEALSRERSFGPRERGDARP